MENENITMNGLREELNSKLYEIRRFQDACVHDNTHDPDRFGRIVCKDCHMAWSIKRSHDKFSLVEVDMCERYMY